MTSIQTLQLLELHARLLFALGELNARIACTICGASITGPDQTDHAEGCPLSTRGKLEPPVTAEKPKKRKPYALVTGDKYRRPDGSFDRSAWAKAEWKPENRKSSTAGKKKQPKTLGLPAALGGLSQ
ncbi:MAG TPA: hypothetical protein V6C86_04705 [Oculatellaceae cyanobacterium]